MASVKGHQQKFGTFLSKEIACKFVFAILFDVHEHMYFLKLPSAEKKLCTVVERLAVVNSQESSCRNAEGSSSSPGQSTSQADFTGRQLLSAVLSKDTWVS